MLTAYDPHVTAMLDSNMTLYRAAWDNPSPSPSPSPSRLRASTKTNYLPWLLGAGALAYLIFFQKKS
jgi:hypothetical protein